MFPNLHNTTQYVSELAANNPTPAPQPEAKSGIGFNWDFLGNVADAIPQVTAQFNRGFQQNQLAIAQANARAAEATALGIASPQRSQTAIWIVVIAALVGLVLLFTLNKK